MPRSADLSLADFAAALASIDPSPGGSCASAVPAAFAAALVAMAAPAHREQRLAAAA